MTREVFVTSFPRSGNTWLNRLLSDLLRAPLQNTPDMEPRWYGPEREDGFVIRKRHARAFEKEDRGRWVLIQRDPRDVVVSAKFFSKSPSILQTMMSLLCRCAPKGQEPFDQCVYERWLRSWLDTPGLLATSTRYELLHTDPVNELTRVVFELTGAMLEPSWVAECSERQGFDKVRSEAAGQFDHSMRRGTIGDWRNHFTRVEGHLFQDWLGPFMLQQQYALDRNWWKSLPNNRS